MAPNYFIYNSFHRIIAFGLYCIFCFVSCESSIPSISLNQPYVIKVTGKNYEWWIKHPGLDGELNTQDDIVQIQDISLPENTLVKILLNSDDFIYFLELPALQQIGSAIPDKNYFLEFQTPHKGEYDLKGNQMCSYTHASLLGNLNVLSIREFSNWHSQNQPK